MSAWFLCLRSLLCWWMLSNWEKLWHNIMSPENFNKSCGQQCDNSSTCWNRCFFNSCIRILCYGLGQLRIERRRWLLSKWMEMRANQLYWRKSHGDNNHIKGESQLCNKEGYQNNEFSYQFALGSNGNNENFIAAKKLETMRFTTNLERRNFLFILSFFLSSSWNRMQITDSIFANSFARHLLTCRVGDQHEFPWITFSKSVSMSCKLASRVDF